jgi:predicted nucleic-acid-binding protein
MIGFDTNLLVRFLVRDDPAQAARVDTLVDESLSSDEAVLLNGIVLCETVWVLESAYGFSRGVVAEVLEKILLTRQFDVEGREEVWRALGRFRRSRGDFADYLLGERNSALGCNRTATFDTALEGEEGFLLL